MKGFQKKLLDNLQLIPEQPNSLNVTLELGVESMTVQWTRLSRQPWIPRPQPPEPQFQTIDSTYAGLSARRHQPHSVGAWNPPPPALCAPVADSRRQLNEAGDVALIDRHMLNLIV